MLSDSIPEVGLKEVRVVTLNVGADISIDRMIQIIERGLEPLPLVIAVTEILFVSRSMLWQYQREVWKRSSGEWWFYLCSAISLMKWGVGLLIGYRVAMGTKPPKVVEWTKGILMSCNLRLHD